EAPWNISTLPVDERGYPIPWFVAEQPDGTRDFRVADPRKIVLAFRKRLCWVCGRPLHRYGCFVVGPLCALNHVSSEPPSHPVCAAFSVRSCPFMTQPKRIRDSRGLEGLDVSDPAGVMIERNPGVALVWWSLAWKSFPAPGGILFDMGDAQ